MHLGGGGVTQSTTMNGELRNISTLETTPHETNFGDDFLGSIVICPRGGQGMPGYNPRVFTFPTVFGDEATFFFIHRNP